MNSLFLFEWMDLPWLPESLRTTVRETLEILLGEPPRRYYSWVIEELLETARREGIETISELGAGTAPLARRLASAFRERGIKGITVEVSDLYPDHELYSDLEKEFKDIVQPSYQPVDFSRSLAAPVGRKNLFVLSAVFHHIPPALRINVLKTLASHRVMVFEPVRRSPFPMFIVLFGLFPALSTPLIYLRRRASGHSRRFGWCWVLPVAPLIIVWDSFVSCLRCWSEKEWRHYFALATGGADSTLEVRTLPLSQVVQWHPRLDHSSS